MSLSSSQLRAARGLLNWSRADLAKRSGVSEPTIHRFENGATEPEARTVAKLRGVFEKYGVEFTDNHGVRFKPKNIEEFDGAGRVDAFYNLMYEELLRCGGDVCVYVYNELVLRKLRKDPELHRKRMKELHDRGLITARVLATKTDYKTFGYLQFKHPVEQSQTPTGYYVFGDCVALVSFVNEASPYVVTIRSAPLAEGYRQTFNIAWKNAKRI